MNPMREIRIEKVTVNIGVGESGERLEKAYKLLERLTGRKPVKTKAKVKVPKWGIRPGLPIGVKVTLRGDAALRFLKRVLEAKDNKIPARSFDERGNFSIGVHEYIELGEKYDPEIGIFGMDVTVTLERPGYRVKRRKNRGRVGKRHLITKEEAINWAKEFLGVEVV